MLVGKQHQLFLSPHNDLPQPENCNFPCRLERKVKRFQFPIYWLEFGLKIMIVWSSKDNLPSIALISYKVFSEFR